jgi:hypothetical protein
MKTINFCAALNEQQAEQFNELKNELGAANNRELLQRLAEFYAENVDKLHNFKTPLTQAQKIETIILKQLKSCYKVKAVTVRNQYFLENDHTAPNRNTVCAVMELYSNEIEEHNSKIG